MRQRGDADSNTYQVRLSGRRGSSTSEPLTVPLLPAAGREPSGINLRQGRPTQSPTTDKETDMATTTKRVPMDAERKTALHGRRPLRADPGLCNPRSARLRPGPQRSELRPRPRCGPQHLTRRLFRDPDRDRQHRNRDGALSAAPTTERDPRPQLRRRSVHRRRPHRRRHAQPLGGRDVRQAGANFDPASLLVASQSLVAVHDWTFVLGPGFMSGLGNGLLLGYLMYGPACCRGA